MLALCRFAALLLQTALYAAGGQPAQASLDQQFQSAVAHFDSGQYPAARQELERLVKALPRSFEVQELLGLVYSAQGQDAKATTPFEEAVRLHPRDGAARNNLAANLTKLGKTTLAENEFRKVVELEPASYDANHNLGEFYIRAGKLAEAIPYLAKAETANPASYDNGYDLSLAYEQEKHYPEARRQIEDLLEIKDTAELHDLLAEVEEKTGDFVAAANEFQTAARMDPSESNLFDWGSELLLHQTWKPAIDVFSAGQNRYPNSSRIAAGLGIAYYLAGSYDDAVKALLKATDLDPSGPQAYYFLNKVEGQAPAEAEEVIGRFRRFAELHPRDPRAAFYYAMSLWKGRRSGTSQAYLDQVESLLKKSIALDPSVADVHLQLGNLYSDRRHYSEAVPEYERALKLSPDIPDAHFRLGQAYSHTGRTELAQAQFQLHQKLYEQHLAEIDKQRSEIQQFVYSTKAGSAEH